MNDKGDGLYGRGSRKKSPRSLHEGSYPKDIGGVDFILKE